MDRVLEGDVPALRRAWRVMGAAVSEVDENLRYRWIDSPMNDGSAIGKRVEDVIHSPNAARLAEFRRQVVESGHGKIEVWRTEAGHSVTIMAVPVFSAEGERRGVLTAWFQTIGGRYSLTSGGTPWILEKLDKPAKPE